MTATAPDTERIKLLLDAFTEIRDDLQKVLPLLDPNFAQGKAPPFPIVEMDLKSAELKCFLGMTYFDKTLPDLEDDTSVQHPPIFFLNLQASLARHVCRIEMKMQLAGRVTDFLRVLPTFLHELAHGYREAIRVRQNTDFQAAHQHAKLKKTTLKPPIDHSTHDDLFYQCFKYAFPFDSPLFTTTEKFWKKRKRWKSIVYRHDLINSPLKCYGDLIK